MKEKGFGYLLYKQAKEGEKGKDNYFKDLQGKKFE